MSMEALIDDATLLTGLQNKADRLPEELKNLVNTAAFAVDREVKLAAPVVTGNLQGATSIDNLSDYEKRIFVDEGIAPYAIYVIKGTRPHTIVSRDGPGSVLSTPFGIFRIVEHPGTKANDYFATGVANAQPAIDSAVEEFKSWIME